MELPSWAEVVAARFRRLEALDDQQRREWTPSEPSLVNALKYGNLKPLTELEKTRLRLHGLFSLWMDRQPERFGLPEPIEPVPKQPVAESPKSPSPPKPEEPSP